MRALVIFAVLIVGAVPSAAQSVRPIIERWDRCFSASTQNQFLANIAAEPNLVAEIAFQACLTEEEALMAFLTLNSMPPANARAEILRHRIYLKRKITG